MDKITKNQYLWWGYYHINGSIQVKRYFNIKDIINASKSAFVKSTIGPFRSCSREEALRIVRKNIKD